MAKTRAYEGDGITIRFDVGKCVHARNCVLGLPGVFRETGRPWVDPDGGHADDIADVVKSCPSGALTFERIDGGRQEPVPPANRVRLWEHGPLEFRGELTVAGERVNRALICRCGASKNKPWCDNSHLDIAFKATSEPKSGQDQSDLAERGGPLSVNGTRNGPLRVTGNLEVIAGSGRRICCGGEHYLCRCGASANKPFCDGSHRKIGFTADET